MGVHPFSPSACRPDNFDSPQAGACGTNDAAPENSSSTNTARAPSAAHPRPNNSHGEAARHEPLIRLKPYPPKWNPWKHFRREEYLKPSYVGTKWEKKAIVAAAHRLANDALDALDVPTVTRYELDEIRAELLRHHHVVSHLDGRVSVVFECMNQDVEDALNIVRYGGVINDC